MRLAPCAPCPISSSTDLLVVLLLGLEAVVNGLEPQVDVGEIVEPVSPPGRNVIHPRHPCPPRQGKEKEKVRAPNAQISASLVTTVPEILIIQSRVIQRAETEACSF